MDLLFGRVEGEVADIQCGGVFEFLVGAGRAARGGDVAVAVAAAFLGDLLEGGRSNGCGEGSACLCGRVGAGFVEALDCAADSRHDGGMCCENFVAD